MICSDCFVNTGVEMWMVVQAGVDDGGWRVAHCYGCDATHRVPPVHEWTDDQEDDMGRRADDSTPSIRDMAADYRPGGSRADARIEIGDVRDAQIRDTTTESSDTTDQ